MSDYMNCLSASLVKSLSGAGSSTGLESINELGGNDDSSNFMSVLSDYMNTENARTIGNSANTVMAEKLQNALGSMDENSNSYNSVKDVYNYLAGVGASSSAVNSLYNDSIQTEEGNTGCIKDI